MKTFATLFSGFGGADCGLKAAGLTPVAAVEYCPKLAEVYRANHGDHVTVADVCDVDFKKLERADWLHASPVCKEFSQAKVKGEESSLDIDTAKATCRAVKCWMPEVVTIENVWGYRHSKSFALICAELTRLGYWFDVHHLNSANFGVAQTRKRLILRASRDGWLPPLPTPTAWRGWYEAIEDLIPTLPDSNFAKWQLERIPNDLKKTCLMNLNNTSREPSVVNGERRSFTVVSSFGHIPSHAPLAFIMAVQGENSDVFYSDSPISTITASHGANKYRAFLVSSIDCTIRNGEKPSNTVVACGDGHSIPPRAWLQHGRVVKMTPRALARFQSFPDTFELPSSNSLACVGIGNAVPSLMMQKIAQGFLS